MKRCLTIRSGCCLVLAAAVATSAAIAQGQPGQNAPEQSKREQEAPPPELIKLRLKKQEVDEKKQAMEEKNKEYAAARKAQREAHGIDSTKTAQERAEADRSLAEAKQQISAATRDWARAENERRALEGDATQRGILLTPEKPGDLTPLGPAVPPRHIIQGGPLLQQLNEKMEPRIKADPTTTQQGVFYDGNAREGGIPPVRIGTSLMMNREEVLREIEQKRLVAEQIAREEKARKAQEAEARRVEAERERARLAREAEARRIEAAQRAETERQRQIANIVRAANQHIENARNVDTSNPAAVQQYNNTTDYYIREYKRLTGKDLTYQYRSAP